MICESQEEVMEGRGAAPLLSNRGGFASLVAEEDRRPDEVLGMMFSACPGSLCHCFIQAFLSSHSLETPPGDNFVVLQECRTSWS